MTRVLHNCSTTLVHTLLVVIKHPYGVVRASYFIYTESHRIFRNYWVGNKVLTMTIAPIFKKNSEPNFNSYNNITKMTFTGITIHFPEFGTSYLLPREYESRTGIVLFNFFSRVTNIF